MRKAVRLGLLVPAAALTVTMLGGCSGSVSVGSKTLDQAKLEQTIKDDLAKAVPEGTEVTVTCDSDVAIKTGTTSACTAKIGDQTLAYSVEQTDDQGNVTYTRKQAVLDLDKAETTVAGQIADQVGGNWTLTCEPAGASRVFVIDVDKTFSCSAEGTDGDGKNQTAEIVMTVKDLEGNVDWKTA